MTILTDQTKENRSKWFEVACFSTDNLDEVPDVVAKFISGVEALKFAADYIERVKGFYEVCVR